MFPDGQAMTSAERRPVVAGVDGTRTWPGVVDLAAAEAARRSAPLSIVHAWPGRQPSEAAARGLLSSAAIRAAEAAPGIEVTTELVRGAPVEVLTERSWHAALVVVHDRDRRGSGPGWGSSATLLASRCASPLLVHRGHLAGAGPVVVGVSGRPMEPAAGYAFALADLLGERLVAVHLWNRARALVPVVDRNDPGLQEATARMSGVLDGWAPAFPRVAVQGLVVAEIDAPYTIHRASLRARLAVFGTGGRGRLAGLLRISFAGKRVRRPPCPVLLVPPGWPASLPDLVAAGSAGV
jgi:nucleotide-binding universal stress UspA family protein